MLQKRVGIFLYFEWLSVSPSIISAIRLLTENDYVVDVFCLYNDSIKIYKPESDKVNLISVKSGKQKWLTAVQFFGASFKTVVKNKYSFFVGVDQEGTITAGFWAKIKQIPYIYYSLEIVTKEDILKEKGLRRIAIGFRRLLENFFSKRAEITVIQDHYRAQVIIDNSNIKKERIFIVPNSYYFNLKYSCKDAAAQYPFNSGKKVVIYTGSIIPEMAIEEIIDSTNYWSDNTVLLLHAPYETDYLQAMRGLVAKEKLEKKIVFSVGQLSFEELCCLIRQASIGISFYRPTSKSFALGPAGKVSFYLSQGVPIITSRVPAVLDFIEKYKCGLCIESPKYLPGAIKNILSNYSEFLSNTKLCYEEELEFPNHFKKVINKIESYGK